MRTALFVAGAITSFVAAGILVVAGNYSGALGWFLLGLHQLVGASKAGK
jgi:hypothetical protein